MVYSLFAEDALFKEISDFMKQEWRAAAREEEETESEQVAREDEELRHKSAEDLEEYDKEEDEYRELKGHTLEEIRRGLGERYGADKIRKTLEENEDGFAHRPHPTGTRYALREHLMPHHRAMGWEPGLDF